MHIKYFIMFFLIIFLGCSKQKPTDDCDSISGDSSAFDSEKYDCPTGIPQNSDIQLGSDLFTLGDIEAGTEYYRSFNIKNEGDSKIFDFEVTATGASLIFANCPAKLEPGDSCSAQIKIQETVSQPNKQAFLEFSDRTNQITKKVPINYNIVSSYPEAINYTIADVDYKTKKVIFGPLKDRFNNFVSQNWTLQTDRKISVLNIQPLTQSFVIQPSSAEGMLEVFLQTDQIDQSQALDSANLTFFSSKVFFDGTTISEDFSITFLNNRPTISNVAQVKNIVEDSTYNLLNLVRGQDSENRQLTYRLVSAPLHGTIANCLNNSQFITLVTCTYTPVPNYFGTDSFSYVVNNGEADSFQIATVSLNIQNVNDAPILSGSKNLQVNEKQASPIALQPAFDPDGDLLIYEIVTLPTKGSLSCLGLSCSYSPAVNQLGSDFFTYRAKDPMNSSSELFTINLSIIQINEAPILGGVFNVSTNEDQSVVVSLPSATDPENDALIYKIQTLPGKGQITGCLNNTSVLSCTYTPNKNIDTADSFSYVAIDPSGLESSPKTVTVSINQINDAPEFTTLYQEVQTTINTQATFILLQATDPENNPVSYELVESPSAGILQDCLSTGTNLTCRYNPPTNVNNSSFEFKYKARDNQGAESGVRTVNIIIKNGNNIPVAAGNMNILVNEDVPFEFSLNTGSDTETESSFLRYRPGAINPSKGVLSNCMTLTGSVSLYDISCTYTPNLDQVGSDSFSYFIVDGQGNQSTETIVSVEIVADNDGPSFPVAKVVFEINEDSSIDFSTLIATDPENNNLVYQIKSGNSPSLGVLSSSCFNQVGLVNNCRYSPNLNTFGKDVFFIEATDPSGQKGEYSIEVNILPVNDSPSILPMMAVTVQEDEIRIFNLNLASDVDNQPFEMIYEVVTQPTKGVLSNCLGISGATGIQCQYSPRSNETGIDSFSYRARDSILFSNTVQVVLNIVPVNNVPYFERDLLGPFRVERGSSFSLALEKAQDIESDPITYQIITAPSKGTLSNCFQGINLTCVYNANVDENGNDSFVYRAFDGVNNSFNNVQVNFILDDKKIERVARLEFGGLSAVAQKQSISTEKSIYQLGANLFFNASNQSNSFSNNSLLMRNAAGVTSSLGNSMIRYKNIIFNNMLYVFDELSSGNNLRIYNQKGELVSIPYSGVGNLFYPMSFNKNIYVGSNSGSLFKVNLITIENNNLTYIQEIAGSSVLGASTGLVETIGVYNNELYFSYTLGNGKKKIAKINQQDVVTKLYDEQELPGDNYLSDFFHFKSNNQLINKIFFFAGDNISSKRLHELDLNDSENSITKINSLASAQPNLINPQIYKNSTEEVILFYNSLSNKVFGYSPLLNLMSEYAYTDVKEIIVSLDKSKVALITQSGEIRTSTNSLIGAMTTIPGLIADWGFSYELNQLVLKRKNINELYVLDEQNAFSQVEIPNSFVLENNLSRVDSSLYLFSPRNSVGGTVYDIAQFKGNVTYDIQSKTVQLLDTLAYGSLGSTYSLISGKEPVNGDLSSCFGISGASAQDATCIYSIDSGFMGQDKFSYRITYPNLTTKDVDVTLNTVNNKPVFTQDKQFFQFANLPNLGEIEEYTLLSDELYLVVNKGSDKVLYRYNQAEGLREITRNIAGFGSLKTRLNYLYYVDKALPNKVYQYDMTAKTTQLVFEDTQQGSSLQIGDLVHVDSSVYVLAKNYGFPPINRLVKINDINFSFELLPLPTGYESGAFIKANDSFYLETTSQFSFFNKTSNNFVDTKIFSSPVIVGQSYPKNSNTLAFHSRQQVGNAFDSKIILYDMTTKNFSQEQSISLTGFRAESFVAPIFNEGGSSVLLTEVVANNNSGSVATLFRDTPGAQDGQTNFFSGPYSFNEQIKEIDGNIILISRNANWSNVQIKRYGSIERQFVLNGTETDVTLPKASDFNLDTISYEIVDAPEYGIISSCLGLNGSNFDDTECVYSHTNQTALAVADSFSYRAFDGVEYSETKVVPLFIKNSAPYFNGGAATLEFTAPQNVPINITIPVALDFDSNNLYYIVTQAPTKGVVSGCISSVQELVNSTRNCVYAANNGEAGMDTFKVRAFDGLSYSEEVIVNVLVSDSPNPVFLTSSQSDYIPNSSGTYQITLEKALDPQGNPVTYEIITQPTFGTLSNCFTIQFNRLVCTYTPNNINNRQVDSFVYRASNGTFNSGNRTVSLNITASAMTGALGDFELDETGPSLIKDGFTNLSSISSLPGYDWNSSSRTLTLPANREYQFRSFKQNPGTKIIFISMNASGAQTFTHGWTKLYSQSSCDFNGEINAQGGQSTGSAQNINDSAIDSELLSFSLPSYQPGAFGGTGGGSSVESRVADFYFAGNPTLFKGGSGQIGAGESGMEAQGGSRGKDGLSLFIKCLSSIEGGGLISVAGAAGAAGDSGQAGGLSDDFEISFGGGGGAGGGNGGHSGLIKFKTELFIFNGTVLTNGGDGGDGGIGGVPNFEYSEPFVATYGIDGESGVDGNSTTCQRAGLSGAYLSCF